MRLVLAVTNFNRLEYFKKCLNTWIEYRDCNPAGYYVKS